MRRTVAKRLRNEAKSESIKDVERIYQGKKRAYKKQKQSTSSQPKFSVSKRQRRILDWSKQKVN